MIAMKDRRGIRPLVYGKNKNNDILISSESCSLNNVLDFNNIKELGMTGDDGDFGPLLPMPNKTTEKKQYLL